MNKAISTAAMILASTLSYVNPGFSQEPTLAPPKVEIPAESKIDPSSIDPKYFAQPVFTQPNQPAQPLPPVSELQQVPEYNQPDCSSNYQIKPGLTCEQRTTTFEFFRPRLSWERTQVPLTNCHPHFQYQGSCLQHGVQSARCVGEGALTIGAGAVCATAYGINAAIERAEASLSRLKCRAQTNCAPNHHAPVFQRPNYPTYFDHKEFGTYGNGYIFGSEFAEDANHFENTPIPKNCQ